MNGEIARLMYALNDAEECLRHWQRQYAIVCEQVDLAKSTVDHIAYEFEDEIERAQEVGR